MGKRGPSKTPTAILKVRGSRWANDRPAEPKPPAAKPICPAFLSAAAKSAWKNLAPQLDEMGVLSRIDRNALARYCESWARWKACAEFIQQYGETYKQLDNDGNVKAVLPWPQVASYGRLAEQLLRLEVQFGLTPSARADLQVERQPTRDAKAAKYFIDAQ